MPEPDEIWAWTDKNLLGKPMPDGQTRRVHKLSEYEIQARQMLALERLASAVETRGLYE